jgi:hypothetical protein
MGFTYLLNGVDDVLFLLCLVVPFRRPREVVAIVGSFVAAESITFIASAFGMAPSLSWFAPLVVALVAMSILYVAVDNVIGLGSSRESAFRRRWITAFVFGLVHGFALSFALGQTLQFAGAHIVTAVLSFNVGIGLGQLLVLLLAIPVLSLLFRFVISDRLGTIVVSALAAHVGWHWLTTRVSQLWRYQFTMPELTPAFFADVLRWLMLMVAVAGVWWLGSLLLKSRVARRSADL